MTERRGGLGRGLAALIPSGPIAGAEGAGARAAEPRTEPADSGVSRETGGTVNGAVYREIAVSAISPNPKQPRQVFDEEALRELEHSIREFGLMQPIVVRELDDERFELIMGERRWRAAERAGLEKIPAIVRQTSDDSMLRDRRGKNRGTLKVLPSP